ncbi:MAG TPA: hypothetical protein VGM56_01680 [Byssovorax sp.]
MDATIAKNRTGARADWRMRLDRARARLTEVTRPPVPTREDRDAARGAREDRDVAAMVKALPAAILRAKAELSNVDAVIALLGGKAVKARRAVHRALADGVIARRPRVNGREVFYVPESVGEAPQPE